MKRALIVGINYVGSNCALNGCVNDSVNIKNLLLSHFGYEEENIVLLNDSKKNSLKPTKKNILKYLDQFVAATLPGDTFFFSYSGHGSQLPDLNGDEANNPDAHGMDSVLCPSDFRKAGCIVDDDLKTYVINKLPKGAKFRSIIDACHSASMFDLPYLFKNHKFIKIEQEDTYCDDCLTISGCADFETSADAYIDKTYNGALTYILLKQLIIPDINWLTLLENVHKYMKDNMYTQIPAISVGNQDIINNFIDL